MPVTVRKTISLSPDLAKEAELLAKARGKTLSGVIQEVLRDAVVNRRRAEMHAVQGYWSRKARERGILTEADLERYLRAC
jgi:predicted transcriptional regulator